MRQRCFASSGIVVCAVFAALLTSAAAAHQSRPHRGDGPVLDLLSHRQPHLGPLIASGSPLVVDPLRGGSAAEPWRHHAIPPTDAPGTEAPAGSVVAVPAPGTTVLAAISGLLIWRRGRSHSVKA
ncbi:MAG: hypothetical protein AAFX05_01690 [Planctomycetota bacterium]